MYKFNNIKNAFGEEWKELQFNDIIPEKKYLVSNFGRIASYDDNPENAVLVTQIKKAGYLSIQIKHSNGRQSFYAHRLIAQEFVKPTESNQTIVIHKDYNKTNNSINNLCWANYKEKQKHNENNPNIKLNHRMKKHPKQVGLKLTSTEVIRIKKKIWDPNRKTRFKMIAHMFGISEMQLYRIRSGENWAHIRVDGEPDWTKRD